MKKRGFTLIELLVVIAIIAILAAILFPVFANAKERGRQARCVGNLKQLTQAFRQYCDDYDGVMPSSCANQSLPLYTYEWTGSKHSARTPVDVTSGQIWKYTRSKGIYLCPTDGKMPAAGIYYDAGGGTLTGAAAVVTDYPFSYSLNMEMGSIYGRTGNDAFLNNLRLDTETAGRSSKVLFLIHEARENFGLEKLYPGKKFGINDGLFSWKTAYNDMPSAIHYDGTVCSYADGHAKWISYDQLLKDADYPNNKYSQWNSNTRRGQLGVL